LQNLCAVSSYLAVEHPIKFRRQVANVFFQRINLRSVQLPGHCVVNSLFNSCKLSSECLQCPLSHSVKLSPYVADLEAPLMPYLIDPPKMSACDLVSSKHWFLPWLGVEDRAVCGVGRPVRVNPHHSRRLRVPRQRSDVEART